MAQRVAVFGYARGAMMAMGMAPARRVGFFASDDSARYLGPNGIRLFNAAIDWAPHRPTRCSSLQKAAAARFFRAEVVVEWGRRGRRGRAGAG